MFAHRVMQISSSPASFSYEDLGSDFSTTDTNSWSFTNFPIGTDDTQERIVYLAIMCEVTSGGTVVSATVDGQTATEVLNAVNTDSEDGIVNIRKATIPASSGTTGTVAVTTTSSPFRLAIYGYAAYNATGEDTLGGGTAISGSNPSGTMDVVKGGVSFCCFACRDSVGTVTPGGDLVQKYSQNDGGLTELRVFAEEGVASTEAGKTHSLTQSDVDGIFAGVSFW